MTDHQPGRRLDQVLVDRAFVDSRSRARDLILRGFVLVSGVVEKRPARRVSNDQELAIHSAAPQFVSRGAEKLTAALDHFSYSPMRKAGLDVGASTGGFTQLLLERGVERVVAVDVGRDQLHPTLREDPRVTVLEQTDARQLTEDQIGGPVDCLV
ncbi:MAG: SAM-dependent methyltransferase, partial [Pseudomonadota bacterium]